ncbi:hypothetical protein CC1G_13791 [Coprinopsis cinerea okayama7|uniref:Uncharacterized protein n=1 Tax=Coprinopsis cinerea (strain Okayama-7 / 130 / ATCC MYA-4618 / FGSC 9003) TaxID=240176 RepID=D6RK99_COPC7|nr:hypothetical protein CC1G_13791 [Coprinopsis cinerea okayama7\|eukprot:XP_002912260.1 hypothetical protein CC1G_13791 [Coprinopsis cinerea okayama7\
MIRVRSQLLCCERLLASSIHDYFVVAISHRHFGLATANNHLSTISVLAATIYYQRSLSWPPSTYANTPAATTYDWSVLSPTVLRYDANF